MLLTMWKSLVIVLLVCVPLASGSALAQLTNSGAPGLSGNNDLTESLSDPTEYDCPEGQFGIIFPAGCSRIHSKSPTVESGEKVPVVYVYCDRYNKQGEGYSVNAWMDLVGADGGNPGMAELEVKVKEALSKLGLVVVKQLPLSHEFPSGIKMEGMDLLTRSQDSVGQAWLRGWIVGDRVYLISAWRSSGDLLGQAGLKEYFNSFQPG